MNKETAFFINTTSHKIFAVLHEPFDNNIHKAFVFCHGFVEEKLWSHRVLVNFARILVGHGYTVLRLDYRGYGDSEGDFSTLSMSDHMDDIQAGVHYLKDNLSEITEIGLLGHRMGATLASLAYKQAESNGSLILWDPIIDGERYIQEFLRSHLTTQLAVYGEVRENRERLVEQINNGALINVEGYDLTKIVYDSVAKINLLNDSSKASQALIVQVGRNEKPKKEFESLASNLNASLSCVVEEPFWREIKRFYNRADNIYEVTLNWMGCN